MTIQDWGALGEIIGAIAVVASLVYLAIQIRQNTGQISKSVEAARLAALERNIESANRMRELMIVNPEIAALFRRGLGSFVDLTDEERFRFSLLMSNTMAAFQGAYIRHLSVGGDPLEFEGAARMIDSIIGKPGARQWQERHEADWRPEFRRFIEKRVATLDRQAESPITDETGQGSGDPVE